MASETRRRFERTKAGKFVCAFGCLPGEKRAAIASAPRGETRPPEASRRAGYSTRCAPSTWSLAARMYGKISTFPKEVDDVAEWLQAIGLVRILLPCRAQCYGKSHALSLPLSLPPSLSLPLSLFPSSHSPNTNRPSPTPWWSRHSCASSPTRNSESL